MNGPIQGICDPNPQADPWVYQCVGGKLEVVPDGPDVTRRCLLGPDGVSSPVHKYLDLKSGECYPTQQPQLGPLSGGGCQVDGSTTCATDPVTDPWFYVCRHHALEVLDHEPFRGAARCQRDETGSVVVVYN